MTKPAATPEDSGSSPQERIEKTFELLRTAKELESESNFWHAAEKFLEAHKLLEALAEEENEKALSAASAPASTMEETEETKRIAALYASKADEYWKQSRQCLIRAMEQEKLHDEQRHETDESRPVKTKDACNCTLLDDDQARARNESFSALFSRPTRQPLPTTTGDNQPSRDIAWPESSNERIGDQDDLEARLRALNRSLPSGFKTTDERMSEVNKGLNKLGLSLYTQKQPFSRFEDEIPKSEDEQIDDIIAQATDEAMVDRINNDAAGGGGGTGPLFSRKQEDDDDFFSDDDDDDNDDDSEEDALLDDDQLAMKTISKQVAKARVKLAELVALLDEARSKKARDEMDEEEAVFKNDYDSDDDDNDNDDDSCRDVKQNDVAFLMMKGKRKLKSAQRDMKKALAEWEDLSLL